MATQHGRSGGLTGLVDLPSFNAKFSARFYRWSSRLDGAQRPRRGRGGGLYKSTRWIFSSGSVACSGKVRLDGYPAPDQWKGQQGTVTVCVGGPPGTPHNVTYPVQVNSASLEFDEKKNDIPNLTLALDVIGAPTYSGWPGTQPSATDPTRFDQEQYEGTSKSLDPQGLASASTRLIDIWGDLGDSDTAETNKLTGVIAAAVAPMAGMKIRSATLARDAVDGGTITISFGLTDTAEDVVNPATVESIDPQKLQSGGTVAAINATPAIPSAPGQTLVERSTALRELNDNKLLRTTTYGQRDTKDDVQMDETQARIDKAGIDSEGQDAAVFNAGATPPADAPAPDDSLQAVATLIQDLNRDRSKKLTFFKVNTTAEEWLYARQRALSDPSNIKNLTIIGALFERGSQPSAPGVAGLVLKDQTLFDVTSPATSNLQGVLWTYAETTSADDELFPRLKAETDPYDLTSSAVTGAIVTTGAALVTPAAPALPPNTVLAQWLDSPLTDPLASNKSVRLYVWALRTSQDAVEQDGTYAKVDDVGIASEGQDTAVYTTAGGAPADAGSPDSSLKPIAHLDQELNRVKSKHVTYFDVNDEQEKWLFARTKYVTDPSLIRGLTIRGAVFDRTGGAPAAPGASGLVLNHTELFDITSPDTSDLQGILWFYSETTSADDEVFPRSVRETDPQDLSSQAVSGEIVLTGAALGSPSAPSTPPHLVLVTWSDRPLTDAAASNKSVRLYTWGLRTTKEAVEQDGTESRIDLTGIESEGHATQVYTTASGAPADAASPDASLKIIAHADQVLNDVKSKRVTFFDVNDAEEKWLFQRTRALSDPSSIKDLTVLGAVFTRGAEPAAPGVAGLVLRDKTLFDITSPDTSDLQGVLWTYAEVSSADEEIYPRTRTETDPQDIDSVKLTGVIFTTGVAPGDPSAPSGLKLTNRLDYPLTDPLASNKSVRIYRWEKLDSADRLTFPRIKTGDDANNIEDDAVRAEIWTAGTTPPATPASPPANNVKLIAFTDTPITPTIGGIAGKNLRVWLYGPIDSADKHVLPNTETVADGNDLASTAITAALDGTTLPDPGAPYVLRTSKLVPLTRLLGINRTLTVGVYGLRDTVDDVQMPETQVVSDPAAIDSGGKQTLVYTTSGTEPAAPTVALPTDAKVVNTSTQPLNRLKSKKLFELGMRTTLEEIQWLESHDVPEVSAIGSKYIAAVVRANSTVSPPAAPAADVVHTHTDVHRITDTKWVHLYHYGRFTDAEQIAADESFTDDDPANLDDQNATTQVTTASTPPATPAAPEAGMVLVSIRTRQRGRQRWSHRFEFGWRSSQSKLEAAQTKTSTDPRDLDTERFIADVFPTIGPPSDPATPGGLKLIERLDLETANPAYRLRVWKYAKVDSADRHELPNSYTVTDPDDLASEASDAAVDGTPTLPAGYVERETKDLALTQGTGADHTLSVTKGGLRTTSEDITMPGTFARLDPLAIDSSGQDTDVYTTASGAGALPAVPSSELQVVSSETLELNRRKSQRVVRFDVLNSEQKRIYPKVQTTDDSLNIDDDAVRAQLWDVGGTPPALPSDVPGNNVKLINFTDVPVTPLRNMRVWLYGPKSSGDRLTLPNTSTDTDPSALQSRAVRAALDGTAISDPSGYVLRNTRTIPVTIGLGVNRTLTVKDYGLRTTKEDIEFPGTFTSTDLKGLESTGKETLVFPTGGDEGTPNTPAGQQLLTERIGELDQAHSVIVRDYGVLNSEQRRTFPKISTTDDALDLEDEAVRAEFWTVGDTPPATPTDAPTGNVKLITFTDVPVAPTRNMRVWLYGPKSSGDKLTLPHNSTDTDPSTLESTAIRAALDGDTISDPAGYVLRNTRVLPVTVGLGVNRTLTIKEYGLRTTQQDVELPNTWASLDPIAIESRGLQTSVYNTGATVPLASGPSGLQQTSAKITVLNNTKSKVEYAFEINNSGQKLTFPETRTFVDPQGLESRATAAALNSAPSTPTGYVERQTRSVQITPTQYVYVKDAGLRSTKDDQEFPKTLTDLDPSGLTTRGSKATVFPTGTSPADPTPPTGTKIVNTRDVQLTAAIGINPGQSVREYEFATHTRAEGVELEHTTAQVTPTESYARTTATVATVVAGDTAASLADTLFAANISDPLFDGVEVRKLTPERALEIIKRANDDKLLRGVASHTYEDAVLGRPPNSTWGSDSSYGNPACVVHVVRLPGQIVGGPGGFTKGLVQPVKLWRHRATYHYRRRIVTADPTTAINAALIGSTNNAALLGFGPHFLMFGPPIIHYCYAISGAHLLLIDYVLNYDSQRWLNDENLADGWLSCRSTSVLLTNTGYVDPTVYFDPGMTLTWPPAAALGGITV